MEILKCLEKFEVVKDYEVLSFKTFYDGFYIKIKVFLSNGSILYIREYVDSNERNYSYHWQNEKGELIIRWDNAPHHKEIKTYPHHKHIAEKVFESFEITCEKILEVIELEIKKQNLQNKEL